LASINIPLVGGIASVEDVKEILLQMELIKFPLIKILLSKPQLITDLLRWEANVS
jgi:hypothetical protein